MLSSVLRSQARLAVSVCRNFATLPTARHGLSRSVARPVVAKFSPTMQARSFGFEAVETREPSKTLFVANVPWQAEDEDLLAVFSTYGEIKEARLVRDQEGASRGFAQVEFANLEDAVKVREMSESEPFRLHGRALRVLYNVHNRNKNDTLVIRHERNMEEEEVRELFQNFNVTDVRFIPPSGRYTTSLTFVQFKDADTASNALDAYKKQADTDLQVMYARPKPEKGTLDNRFGGSDRGGDRFGGSDRRSDRRGGGDRRGDRFGGGGRGDKYGDDRGNNRGSRY